MQLEAARSLRMSLEQYDRALGDADECIRLQPEWAKGYSRRGAAYVVLGRYKDAIEAYNAGLAIEPGNAGLQKGLDDLRRGDDDRVRA